MYELSENPIEHMICTLAKQYLSIWTFQAEHKNMQSLDMSKAFSSSPKSNQMNLQANNSHKFVPLFFHFFWTHQMKKISEISYEGYLSTLR